MGFVAQQQSVPGVQAQMDPIPDCGENSHQGSSKLLGKKAIITGGDSGIGRAVAIAFAREGADVLIAYLNEDEERTRSRPLRRQRRPQLRTGARRSLRRPALPRRRRPGGAGIGWRGHPGRQLRLPDDAPKPRRDQRRGVGVHILLNIGAYFHLAKAAVRAAFLDEASKASLCAEIDDHGRTQ